MSNASSTALRPRLLKMRPPAALPAFLLLFFLSFFSTGASAGFLSLPALLTRQANGRYDPINVDVGGLTGLENAPREEPADSTSAGADAGALEGVGGDKKRVGAIVGGVCGGLLLILVVGCCCCCGFKRAGYAEFLPGGSLSDRSSLVALREFASGGIGGTGESGRVSGGWWRSGRKRDDGRYAADSLEMDFAKPKDGAGVSVDEETGQGGRSRSEDEEGALEHGVYLVDSVRTETNSSYEGRRESPRNRSESGEEGEARETSGAAGLVEVRMPSGDNPGSGEVGSIGRRRGNSLVGELGDSGWAQVERDVSQFDYVIGVGPTAEMEDWMQNHLASPRAARGRRRGSVEVGRNTRERDELDELDGSAAEADSAASPSVADTHNTGITAVEDPPLVSPFGSERYPDPRKFYASSQ